MSESKTLCCEDYKYLIVLISIFSLIATVLFFSLLQLNEKRHD